ncbi:hypothetical protein PTNB73_08142 [Pyrenophora teres f. teres]|nr:hypothetical protein HRS9139_07808 [Pyrenophora teres f. teres]KAE8837239.1 hypothetical protein HRS9122_07394 [Pyrenophora teres f. teres]KAE8855814.1 hypothetical protein PTNB29_08653 [Pyrenophora teres f. teres]KAE8860532.1 hypothetical protein PTNB73_08142 [Pyrenophora teres f. teres]
MTDQYNKMVGKQQKLVGMYVGIGVGIFVLVASIAIWAFWRHSRKRKRAINQQSQLTSNQPMVQQTATQQQWQSRGVEADGLAYKTELEAQHNPERYQEMNAYSHTNPFQGGHIVEAQSTRDPHEMPQTFWQHARQEMPGDSRSETAGRRDNRHRIRAQFASTSANTRRHPLFDMMLLNAQALILAALFSALATGRPLDSHDVLPRDKTYAVVNVGGDSPTQAPPTATSTVATTTTTTVEVVSPEKTVTQETTTTVVKPEPAPAPTTSSCTPPSSSTPASTSSSSSSSSSSTPSPSTPSPMCTPLISNSTTTMPNETPKPIFVTVTVAEPAGTTDYYDDGMWHTRYAIKSFGHDAAVATPSPQV